MSDEHRHRDDQWAIVVALFRYSVIAPLVEAKDAARGWVTEQVRKIASVLHYLPSQGPTRVAERTVYHWWKLYQEQGLDGLRPKVRRDQGRSRKLPEDILTRAIQLRQENPRRKTKTLIDILVREGRLQKEDAPHRSTFDRHLRRRRASRRHLMLDEERTTIEMEFESFGDLWLSDFHHGPLVLGPDGKPITAKLCACFDHKTRYPVSCRYYLNEQLGSLRDTMQRAFLKMGKCVKLYVDRGKVYLSFQLAYSLLRIGVRLVHSRAYYAQGRGAMEAFWKNAKDFESEVALRPELPTLHELNRLWEAYFELLYCEVVHSELGMTPNQAIANVKPQPLPPDVVRQLFLARADRTVNKKNLTVSIENHRFLCDRSLRGERVRVHFDPHDLSSVLIFALDGSKEPLQRAFPFVKNAKPEPHRDPPQRPTPSVDYLALIREDYDRQLLEHAQPLAYTSLDIEPGFDVVTFIATVTDLAGLDDNQATTSELRTFWETFGPLPESLVRIGVEHAVRLHTRGRHARVYLHSIRTLVLAQWQSHEKKSQ